MKTTFSRIFFPTVLILLASLLLVGTTLRAQVSSYLENQTMESLHKDAEAISALASAYYSEGTLSGQEFLVNLSIASQVSGADAVICDDHGKLLLCSDEPFGCAHQGSVIQDKTYLKSILSAGSAEAKGRITGLYDEPRYMVTQVIRSASSNIAVGIVLVSTPMTATTNLLQRLTDIYLLISLLVVMVSMFVMTIVARMHSRPLQTMARTATDFGHGNLNARVRLQGVYTQEIDELALAFNNMATSLQQSEYQRQEFVANVSHELKTPMTTIGGYVDGILDGTIPPEKSRYYMQIVSDETKRLSRLVRSMLDISRLQDQGGIPEEKKLRFDLEECAGQVLITFEQKITGKGVNVQVDMPDYPVYTIADPDAITQVIYNLVDNAVKFCPAGGTIGLKLRQGGTKAYVSVFNDGETIPPEELPLVFDRFHKLDKSRTQNRDGWGLGLYIVKTIICSHGEDISVSSANGRTEFTFTLPLVN